MHVMITGANRGIGRELASSYAAAGAKVTATARRPKGAEVALDVTDLASVQKCAAGLAGEPVDLLVCNAGVYLDKGHRIGAGYGPEIWADTFATNVTGVYLTIEAMLKSLRAARNPKIAIISSVMASSENAAGGSYVYRASKAAALNLGRNLARDLAADGIAVGIYHPGWVRTDMGGDMASVDVASAARGLRARFDALSIQTTGVFEAYDGTAMRY